MENLGAILWLLMLTIMLIRNKKGIQQGDILLMLISSAKADMQVCEVVQHLIEGELSILHTDDTTLKDYDLEKACNMKLLPCAFKQQV